MGPPRPRGCSARAELERVRSFFDNLAVNTNVASRQPWMAKPGERGGSKSALAVGQAFQPDVNAVAAAIRSQHRWPLSSGKKAWPAFCRLTAKFRFQKRLISKSACKSERSISLNDSRYDLRWVQHTLTSSVYFALRFFVALTKTCDVESRRIPRKKRATKKFSTNRPPRWWRVQIRGFSCEHVTVM